MANRFLSNVTIEGDLTSEGNFFLNAKLFLEANNNTAYFKSTGEGLLNTYTTSISDIGFIGTTSLATSSTSVSGFGITATNELAFATGLLKAVRYEIGTGGDHDFKNGDANFGGTLNVTEDATFENDVIIDSTISTVRGFKRKIDESGGGWARVLLSLENKASSENNFEIGSYGGGTSHIYTYFGYGGVYNGSENLKIYPNGDATFGGSVTAPTITLDRGIDGVSPGDAIGAIDFYNSDNSSEGNSVNARIVGYASDIYGRTGLQFWTGDKSNILERLNISSGGDFNFKDGDATFGGNVGFGTSSPTTKVQIKASNEGSTGGLSLTDSETGLVRVVRLQDSPSGGRLYLTNTEGDENIVLNGNGDATFGGSVNATDGTFNKTDADGNAINVQRNGSTISRIYSATNGGVFDLYNGSSNNSIRLDGRTGGANFEGSVTSTDSIKATSASYNNHIKLSRGSIEASITLGANGLLLSANADASESLFVQDSGRIGINETSPSYDLDVNGTFRVVGESTFGGNINLDNSKYLYGDGKLVTGYDNGGYYFANTAITSGTIYYGTTTTTVPHRFNSTVGLEVQAGATFGGDVYANGILLTGGSGGSSRMSNEDLDDTYLKLAGGDVTGDLNIDADITIESGHNLMFDSENGAWQKGDARDDGDEARIHWHGRDKNGSTSGYKAAWYTGSQYINITGSGTAIEFNGDLKATNLSGTTFKAGNNESYYADDKDGTSHRLIRYGTNNHIYLGDGIGEIYFKDETDTQKVYHEGNLNLGDYVPKAGGTITGGVTIDTNTGSSALTIKGTSPTISFLDDDGTNDDFYIHVNSNNFYVLANRTDNENKVGTGWEGAHPLQLEADTSRGILFGQAIVKTNDARLGYGDHSIAGYLNTSGGTITGDLQVNGNGNFGQVVKATGSSPIISVVRTAANDKGRIDITCENNLNTIYSTDGVLSGKDFAIRQGTSIVYQNNADGSHDFKSGSATFGGSLSVNGDIDVLGNKILMDSDTGIVNSGDWNKFSTRHGYISLGPANTTWAHIYTDRPNFYFNKDLYVLGQKLVKTNDTRLTNSRNPNAGSSNYVQAGSRYSGDASAITNTSIRLWDVSTASDNPVGAGDGLITTGVWDSSGWATQQYHDFHSNKISIRSKQSETWQSDWATVWTTDQLTTANKSNYDTAYGWGNHASAGYLSNNNHDRVYITDSRGEERKPNYYNDRYAQWDFQHRNDTLASGTSWHAIQTISKWTIFNGGHSQEQVVYTGGDVKHRIASSDTAWGAWRTYLDSSNYNSYAPTKTGGGASGDWSINARTAGGANGNFYIDDDYGKSVIGKYNASRFQGVYSMGSSYILDANGVNTGNLYGIAWTHSNNPNTNGKKIHGHHACFMAAGTTRTAIGDSIWTAGNVTGDNFILDSDKRLKKDFLNLEPKRLKPQRWTWKESGKKDFGFIAQDVEVDFPEIVITAEDGYKRVAYNKITAINAARINELEEEVLDLKSKLKSLLNLESRINQLENK